MHNGYPQTQQGSLIVQGGSTQPIRKFIGDVLKAGGFADFECSVYSNVTCEVLIVFNASKAPVGNIFIAQRGLLLQQSNNVINYDAVPFDGATIYANAINGENITIKRSFNGLSGIHIQNQSDTDITGVVVMVTPFTQTTRERA